MGDQEETIQAPDFRDRKTWLVVFGILEIIFGAFCALMMPIMVLGIVASSALDKSSGAPMNTTVMIPGILLYLVLAVWFIWMGIGSIKARRWARALILVSSWIWLVAGIIGLFIMVVLMPDIYGKMAEVGQIPSQVANVMKYGMTGFMAVFFLVIPGMLVLFYGSRNVKSTCEFRDSKVRWTDRCPLPVLALTLMFGFGALFMLSMVFYGSVIPFFGILVTGIPGLVLVLAMAILLGSLAWGSYKLNLNAWWGSVALITLGGISVIVTLSRVSILEFYEKMNFPAQQIQLIQYYGLPQSFHIAVYTGIWMAGFLGYLIYTRRYFVGFSFRERV
jgi:hypothetical protein